MERAAAGRRGERTQRSSGSEAQGQEVARTKNAARDGRIILCIDEGGLSCRPCGAGPWAPGGQTPILQYSFSREQLSVIADLSYWRICFRLFSGALKTPQFVEFLQALQATTGKNLPAIWDRLQAHRWKVVRKNIEAQHGQIAIDYLPPYAPGLLQRQFGADRPMPCGSPL